MYHLYRVFTIIHETIHISRKYNVAAAPWSQFMAHAVLFYTINILCLYIVTFQSTCTVLYDCFSVLCFLVMFLRCSLDDFVIDPFALLLLVSHYYYYYWLLRHVCSTFILY